MLINTKPYRCRIRIKRMLLSLVLLLTAIGSNAQTLVTAPMTGTPAAGSYYSFSNITLNPTFSFTAASGSTLSLYIANPDCQPLNSSFSAGQNYILTSVPRISGFKNAGTGANTGDFAGRGTCELMQTVQYFDGLGRPLQTVQVKGSTTGRDIVQPITFDAYGREAIKYQPYVATAANSNGSYKGTAVSDQAAFYVDPSNSATWNSPGVKATTAPYAQTVFEQSPLSRVTEQGAPGTDWQPSGTTGHTIKVAYTANNTTPVSDTSNTYYAALYTVGAGGSLLYGINGQNNYLTGKLYVTVSKDENWKNTGIGNSRGGTTEEYKDQQGHVILKRTFNFVTGPPGALQILSTYYVYDDLGNLCYVLPPGSGADGGITSALNQDILNGVCYQYKYDGRNRLVEKKVPGKGWEYTVYNKLDQIVATQDANQRNVTPLQQASFTKYDALGRVALTGIYKVPNATVAGQNYRTNMQSDANNQATLWESRQNVGTSGTTDYTSSAYPQTDFTPLTINYYDNYTAIPGRPGYYLPAVYSTQTTGLLTASRTAVLNSPTVQLLTVHAYDDKGREIGTYSQHYKGGLNTIRNYDGVTRTYDFTNAVTTTTRKHYIYDAAYTDPQLKLTVWNRYLYDHMGRKIKTWQQITNADGVNDLSPDTKTLLSSLVYNELGQLWQKNLHTTDTTGTGNSRQTVTYGYNERGWLSSSLSGQFNMYLYYNDATSGKQYNGNIVNQVWQAAGGMATTYTYSYDQLSRLTKGLSTAGNNESNITYDPRGNILTLNRYATSAVTLIDQLIYNYSANSNQLGSVTDNSGNALGQKTGTATYGYDLNGNLTSDNSRGIAANGITYNLLNLPQSIAALNTTYTYDATGRKLRKVITGTGASTTEYIGGIQYNGTSVDLIQTEEGRALPNGATNYNYEYSLTDHLGNNRVNFDTGTGSTARQVQTDDYYPFGMESNSTALGTKSLYLYNKKELQLNGLNLYDYGARFYDPVIARWTSVDPLAEISRRWSPYNYVENNPIRNIDPDGMWTEDENGVHSDNAAEAQAFFKQLQGSQGGPGDKNKKKPEKQSGGFFSELTKHYTGPLEATMTSEQRAEYYKESAKSVAWIMGGEALSLLKLGRLFPWISRLFSSAGEAATVEISVEEFAHEIIQINRATEGGGVLLSSTPEAAINSALYYEKPIEQGAAIYRSIISNHMFIDGNKRTAVLVLEAFAKKVGVKVANQSQLMNIATKVATEHLDVAQIVKLISK
jgi:RHS repeat-associated protein